MSADRDIDAWLAERGYGFPEARARARGLMEAEKLTHAGKKRISEEKFPRVEALLGERFFVQCGAPACLQVAKASGREPVLADRKIACERCGGSDNRRAETELLEICAARGVKRLVVVGGSPSVRDELDSGLGDALELRMVDGTERRTQSQARNDLEWADLVMVWGATELNHKVSLLYTHGPAAYRGKVVQIAKRGVAALLIAAVEHLKRR